MAFIINKDSLPAPERKVDADTYEEGTDSFVRFYKTVGGVKTEIFAANKDYVLNITTY